MYMPRKTQKLKKHNSFTFHNIFHNFALEIETSSAARMVNPILKTRNVNDDES